MGFSVFRGKGVQQIIAGAGISLSSTDSDGGGIVTISSTGGGGGGGTSGVDSFNSRTGAVTLSSADVIGALGYTPAASSSSTALGGVNLGSVTINQSTPNQRVLFADTVPNGWNGGIGKKSVDFEFISTNFFAANPGAHFAVVTRCTSSLIATAVRGQGLAFGANLSTFNPTTVIETWMNSAAGAPSDNYLQPNSHGPTNMGLQDGVTYRMLIETTKAQDGNRYIRYRVYRKNTATTGYGAQSYTLDVDTGDVLDHNVWADLTQYGLCFAYVFATNLSAWSVAINNINVVWGPAPAVSSDLTGKLSKFGDYMKGDLNFPGNQRILVNTTTSTDWTTWTSVQNSNTNNGTSLLVKPNGTSVVSNFAAVNTSNPASSWAAVTFGMNGANAEIVTGNLGQTDPNILLKVGTNTILNVASTGLSVTGLLNVSGNTTISGNTTLNGNVTMAGAKDFNLTTSSSTDWTTWTAFKTTTANYGTSVLAKPNGTATVANFAAVNTSSPSSSWQAVTFGMNGSTAEIATGSLGSTNPPLALKIGTTAFVTISSTGVVFNQPAITVNGSGILINGASAYIGQNSSNFAGISGMGGSNAINFVNSAGINFDTACAAGYIASFLGGSYSASAIEGVVRPVWAAVSALYAEVKNRKVF